MKKSAFTALSLSAAFLAAPANATSTTVPGPTPGTAAPSAFVVNNQQHFNYLTTTGGIHDTWYDGATGKWQGQDIFTGTNALAGASPQGSIFGSQQHVAWIDDDNQMQDEVYANGSRTPVVITPFGVTFPDPSRGFNIATFIGQQQHFVYLDSAGIIQDRYYDDAKSGFVNQPLNSATGTVRLGHDAAMAPAVIEVDATNFQTFHYTYFARQLGAARFVDDVFTIVQKGGAGEWTELDSAAISTFPVLPAPRMGTDGPSSPIVTSVNTGSQIHASYVSGGAVGGDLVDLWSNDLGYSWSMHLVNHNTSLVPSNVIGRPSVWSVGTQQHFTYRTAFGSVFDSYYDNANGTWHIQPINGTGGRCADVGDEVLSDPTGSVYNGQQHIAFVESVEGRGNALVDCWYNGSVWQSQYLN